MLLIKEIKNLVTIAPRRKRNNSTFLLCFLFVCQVSCSEKSELIGASWEGNSDFMVITEKMMKMHYSSYIPGNSVFIGGFYEVLQDGSNIIIDRLEVQEIEFQIRTDGTPYCRIWGNIENSTETSYLLADKCKPIYQK